MKKFLYVIPLILLSGFTIACGSGRSALSETERTAIADSAKAVIRAVWDAGKALDAAGVCEHFTRDPDGRFVEDGRLVPFEALLPEYTAAYSALESGVVTPSSIDALVLARDSVALTAPCTFSIKTKAGVSYTGKVVLTLVVQQRNGVWQIVLSHISHQDVPGIMAAFEQKPPET